VNTHSAPWTTSRSVPPFVLPLVVSLVGLLGCNAPPVETDEIPGEIVLAGEATPEPIDCKNQCDTVCLKSTACSTSCNIVEEVQGPSGVPELKCNPSTCRGSGGVPCVPEPGEPPPPGPRRWR
jgi:hypothetical protein